MAPRLKPVLVAQPGYSTAHNVLWRKWLLNAKNKQWCLQITGRLKVHVTVQFTQHFVATRERMKEWMNGWMNEWMVDKKMPFTYIVQQLFLCITEMLLVGEYLVGPEKPVAASRKINVTLQFIPLFSQHYTAHTMIGSLCCVQSMTGNNTHYSSVNIIQKTKISYLYIQNKCMYTRILAVLKNVMWECRITWPSYWLVGTLLSCQKNGDCIILQWCVNVYAYCPENNAILF